MSVTAIDTVGIEEMPASNTMPRIPRPWANLLPTLEPNKAIRLAMNGPKKEAQQLIAIWGHDVKRYRPGYAYRTRIVAQENGDYYVYLSLRLKTD